MKKRIAERIEEKTYDDLFNLEAYDSIFFSAFIDQTIREEQETAHKKQKNASEQTGDDILESEQNQEKQPKDSSSLLQKIWAGIIDLEKRNIILRSNIENIEKNYRQIAGSYRSDREIPAHTTSAPQATLPTNTQLLEQTAVSASTTASRHAKNKQLLKEMVVSASTTASRPAKNKQLLKQTAVASHTTPTPQAFFPINTQLPEQTAMLPPITSLSSAQRKQTAIPATQLQAGNITTKKLLGPQPSERTK